MQEYKTPKRLGKSAKEKAMMSKSPDAPKRRLKRAMDWFERVKSGEMRK